MAPLKGSGTQLDPWRYIVLLSKCGVCFIHHGTFKALGVLLPSLTTQLNTPHSTMGFVSSLQFTVTFLACPVAQQLSRRFGTRLVATLGGVLATASLMLTWFSTSAATMGVLFCLAGFGASMPYQSSHATLKEHFGDRFGAVNTLSMTCSTLGSMFMVGTSSVLLEAYGPRNTLLLISALTAHHIVFGATFRPPAAGMHKEQATASARNHRVVKWGKRASWEPLLPSADPDQTNQDTKTSQSKADTCNSDNDNVTKVDSNQGLGAITESIPQRLLDGVKRVLAVDAFAEEPAMVFIFFPSQILFDIAYTGWCLFVVSFGLSVGLDSLTAPLLAIAGAAGGFVGKGTVAILLHFKPNWAIGLLFVNILTLLAALLLYSAGSSLPYLIFCSFLAGHGLYGAPSSFIAAISTSVSEQHFPDILAMYFFIAGSGIPVAGAVTGHLYDVTQSFRTVFQIFAGMLAISLLLCTAYIIYGYKRANAGAKTAM